MTENMQEKRTRGGNIRQPVILLSGFGPFGGEIVNPSELLLSLIPDEACGLRIAKLLLPVEFIRSRELIISEYEKVRPDAVIMLGQAGGRRAVTPEERAVNEMDSVSSGRALADSAGFAPSHLPVLEGGPDVIYTVLPVESIAAAVNAAGVLCEVSRDAGRYVCNSVYYAVLHHTAGKVPAVFIHVPYIREQGHEDRPYLELGDLKKGIMAAISKVAALLGEG